MTKEGNYMNKKGIFVFLALLISLNLFSATLKKVDFTFMKPAAEEIPLEIKNVYILFVTEETLEYDKAFISDLQDNPVFNALYTVMGEETMIVKNLGQFPDWLSIAKSKKNMALALECQAIIIVGLNRCDYEANNGWLNMVQKFKLANGEKTSIEIRNPIILSEPQILGSFNILDLNSNKIILSTLMFEKESLAVYERKYVEGVTQISQIFKLQSGDTPTGKPSIENDLLEGFEKVDAIPAPELILNRMFSNLYQKVCAANLPKEETVVIVLNKLTDKNMNKAALSAVKKENYAGALKIIEDGKDKLVSSGKDKDKEAYYYNRAMLNEMTGNLQAALEHIVKAEDSIPDKLKFKAELNRITSQIELYANYPNLKTE